MAARKCKRCRGTGSIRADLRCSACGGTGQMAQTWPRSLAELESDPRVKKIWRESHPTGWWVEVRDGWQFDGSPTIPGTTTLHLEDVDGGIQELLRRFRGIRLATYPVKRGDGSVVRATVPPSACKACGGEGCERCKNSDGYEPGEV